MNLDIAICNIKKLIKEGESVVKIEEIGAEFS